MIASPCVQTCTLDPHSGRCLGCGRTIDEIARWGTMDAAERERIMADLPARREPAQRAAAQAAG
jgi:predicted Fe-S protein YdhL (DUF1289 family)